MYIDTSKLTWSYEKHKPDWKFFEITPQDFHRNRHEYNALIIDHPGINSLYEEFAYLRNGKLNLLLPEPWYADPTPNVISFRYKGRSELWHGFCDLPHEMMGDWHWDDCFLTDSELKMLLHLRYPRFCQNKEEEDTVLKQIRECEYRGYFSSDGLLKPDLDLPAPYNDILYNNFAEPWAPITFE